MAVTWPRAASSCDRVNTSAHVTTRGSMALAASAVTASLKGKWCQRLARPTTLTASYVLSAGGWSSLYHAGLCSSSLPIYLQPWLHSTPSGTGKYSSLFGGLSEQAQGRAGCEQKQGPFFAHHLSVPSPSLLASQAQSHHSPYCPLPRPTLGPALLPSTVFWLLSDPSCLYPTPQ